ncbi:unnamed protein product, partial [Vitis vinifera]
MYFYGFFSICLIFDTKDIQIIFPHFPTFSWLPNKIFGSIQSNNLSPLFLQEQEWPTKSKRQRAVSECCDITFLFRSPSLRSQLRTHKPLSARWLDFHSISPFPLRSGLLCNGR